MINAAIVGLGWWGKTLVESLADGSDLMRFAAMICFMWPEGGVASTTASIERSRSTAS